MLKMAVGQSDDVDPVAAIDDAIAQCRAQLGDVTARVGVLFIAQESFDPALVGRVTRAFPGIDIMGATSAAEMSSAAGYREDSIALSVFGSDDIEMSIGFGTSVDHDTPAEARAAVDEARSRLTQDPSVCIVLTESVNAERAMKSLGELLPGVLLAGGAAGRSQMELTSPTYQFHNDHVASSGVAILLMAGPIAYSTAVGTGWRNLGPQGIVTRARYGVIEEIDGRPAAEWTDSYLRLGTGATYGNPLAIRDPGSEDWYLRVALAVDKDAGLVITGAVPSGATIQLTTTNPDEMLSATEDAVERARAKFPAGSTPEAALFFSCAVRKYLLGSRTGQEVALARTVLPDDLPMAGMYCIGEIAPAGLELGSRFLNETFVTLLLGS